MQTKDFDLDLKEVGDDGTFAGYGSIFGNADSYGEIVEPGAFAASLRAHAKAKTMPMMLWQHDTWQPIGVWTLMEEDQRGLRCEGRLLLGVKQADEAHIMLKAGAIRGLSIGYRELAAEPDGNNRRLKKLDLREVSIVSFPANDKATVTSVKAERAADFVRRLRDGEPPSTKEFEDILGDLGVPKALRAGIASHGYAKAIRSDSGGIDPAVKSAMTDLRAALDGFLNPRT